MGTIQQVIEAHQAKDITFIPCAVVLWRSEKKGPYNSKKDGREFYMMSLLVSDESVPKDADGKDGRFVNFSWHADTENIQPGAKVEFKLKYGEYNGKLSLNGTYLKKAESTPAYLVPSDMAPSSGQITPPADNAYKLQVEEYQSLIKQVIDPLFNKLWGRLPKDQQTEFYNANMGLVKALNRYLPE